MAKALLQLIKGEKQLLPYQQWNPMFYYRGMTLTFQLKHTENCYGQSG